MATDSSRSDNSGLEAKIEEVGTALSEGRLPQRYFNDPDLYDLELERIFGQAWIFVGHESEVPTPGDYVVRTIGEDQFIFARDEDGEVQVHFNSCRHRGTQVCRSESGNSSHFRCPYHGWTYNNKGELVGVPQRDEAFPDIDESEWALASPRVDSYKGLVFASVAEEGPSLDEYLGDAKWYLDMQVGMTKGGMEVVGEPHRNEVDIDWKARPDNASGDNYHVQMTHLSNFEAGVIGASDMSDPSERNEYVRNVSCGPHAINLVMLPPGAEPNMGYPRELVDNGSLEGDQEKIFNRAVTHTGTIYPNLSFVNIATSTSGETESRGALLLRKWAPRGSGKIEMINWVLVPKEASEEYKKEAYRAGMANFGPGGNFEADDLTMWVTACEAAGSNFAEQRDLELNYEMGLNREFSKKDDDVDTDTWPGTVHNSWLDEASIRNYHLGWYDAMSKERDLI